jgi:adenosylmethionine-8-amino-7-oxononanoate aminotransferase
MDPQRSADAADRVADAQRAQAYPTLDDAHALAELDRRYVWHPFTQMADWQRTDPVIVDRAEGCWLVDTHGRRYLDGVSSLWVTVHGHGRQELNDAIGHQLDLVAHSTLLGLGNVPSIRLAARLVSLAPGALRKVFYSDSGSTAVEVALKMAFQYWRHRGRPDKARFVCLDNAYHGDTIGAVSVGGIDLFHQLFHPLLFRAERIAPSIDALRTLLEARSHELAALIVEPMVQGAAGMVLQPPGFMAAAAELCRDHEVLLICDEVATGFGRTGKLFACEHEGVEPDLMACAKGLTGGYLPLAATLATDEIYDAFLGSYGSQRTFFHGHTYTGNPLACAAALASLDLFDRDRTLERLAPKIQRLTELLKRRISPLRHVGAVRQLGMMVGIELVADRDRPTPYRFEEAIGARVCADLRHRGVVLRPLGPVVVMMPPLVINEDELELLVGATAESIAHVTEKGP